MLDTTQQAEPKKWTPAPTSTTGAGSTTPPTGVTAEQTGASALLRDWLRQVGFSQETADGLSSWAWTEIVQGKSLDEIKIDLQSQPAFKQEFPEIDLRRQAGLPAMTVGQILEYRQRGAEAARAAGLPASFYDNKDDFTRLISAGVSLDEYVSRVRDAQLVAYQVPADVRAQFAGTLGIGDFTALAFDPDTALPLLDRKVKEAEVLAGAARGGYSLDAAGRAQVTDALAGAQAGNNVDNLARGFGELTNSQELFTDLSGTGAEGGQIGQAEQLGAAFGGNANAQRRIAERAARRKAQFEGGAGFGASQSGVSGLSAG